MINSKNLHFWACLVVLALLAADSLQAADQNFQTLRVVTWNIEWFPGRTPQPTARAEAAHREAVAAHLPTLEPDILILQEIRDREAAEFLIDQFSYLTLHIVSQFERPNLSISQQIVIASRFRVMESQEHTFTGDAYDYGDAEAYRGFVFTALESPFGGTLLVYGVHLKSNYGDPDVAVAMRESGAHQLLEHVAQTESRYTQKGPVQVVIGGDFNVRLDRADRADEQTIKILTDAGFHNTWKGLPFEERVTWPPRGNFPPACFDYIFTKGLPAYSAELLHKPAWELSDHRPVLLSIPKNLQTDTK